MAEYRNRIEQKLTEAFSPACLTIKDESDLHVGHVGANHDGKGETHFDVQIIASAFIGESRVKRQRRIYALLATELKERVHALSLTTLTPAEARERNEL